MQKQVKQAQRRRKKKSVMPAVLVMLLIIVSCAKAPDLARKYIYPTEYGNIVTKYARKYDMDPNFIFAVIKTESNFDPYAESDVGARGLMQLMEDAFDWVGYRMEDERQLTYDHMYVPEYNIQYGTYLLMLLYEEYGDEETALAAYHSGRGNVNNWLKDNELSSDGKTLDNIPSSATSHYVDKVMTAYEAYNNLWGNQKF